MRIAAMAFVSCFAGVGATSCGPSAADYRNTDLPFHPSVVMKAGATFSETPEGGGPSLKCSGVVVEALKLGDRDLPLADGEASADCFFETKDYGKLRISLGAGASVLVTAEQEAELRKLVGAAPPGAP